MGFLFLSLTALTIAYIYWNGISLRSGLVLDHSQNRTVAANAIAERYVSGHLS